MKNITVLILFLFYNCFFGQTKTFEATYSIKIIENDNFKNLPENLKNIYYGDTKIVENMEPKLYFNDSISEYKLTENILGGETGKFIFCGCIKPVFTNIKNKTKMFSYPKSVVININENEYLVLDSLKTNWKLTNETKNIKNYKVYKATQEIKYNGTVPKFKNTTKTIIAWYCPEIPYSFGPKGYGGLPGLIIELQDDDSLLGLLSMKEVNNYSFDYQKTLNTGKKVTEEELNKIIQDKHSGDPNHKK